MLFNFQYFAQFFNFANTIKGPFKYYVAHFSQCPVLNFINILRAAFASKNYNGKL